MDQIGHRRGHKKNGHVELEFLVDKPKMENLERKKQLKKNHVRCQVTTKCRHKCSSDIDGGYGWVIVTASFFNAFIIDGIGSSIGLLLPYMKNKFNATDFEMSFASSLFMAFLIMGTVSVFLTSKFGLRLIAIIGGLLSCASFMCSAFVPNKYAFILFYGLITGCACGLVFLPSVIIVNTYFHKLRGVANGIICAGSGAGLVVMSPLIKYLLEHFGLDNTILILSGVLLHMCVFSCLYRPPPLLKNLSGSLSYSSCSESSEYRNREAVEDACQELMTEVMTDAEVPLDQGRGDDHHDTAISKGYKTDFSSPLTFTKRVIDLYRRHQKVPWKSECQLNSEVNTAVSHSLHTSTYNLPTWYHSVRQEFVQHKTTDSSQHKKSNGTAQHHLSPQDQTLQQSSQLYLAGSITTLRSLQQKHEQGQLQPTLISQQLTNPSKLVPHSSDPVPFHGPRADLLDPGLPLVQLDKPPYQTSETISSVLVKKSLENNNNEDEHVEPGLSLGQLLCLPSFHLFYIGASLIQIAYPIVFTFLVNYVEQLGHPNTAMLMSLLGALNICGRCLAGVLASLKVDPFHLNNISLLLVGISCMLCPVYQEFWSLCLFSAVYGFFLGFFPPLQPLIIVKYFGLGSLATGFGFLTTIKGLASFPGAPLAGWIKDTTGDYSWSFVFGGAVFFLSGLVHYLMMFVQ